MHENVSRTAAGPKVSAAEDHAELRLSLLFAAVHSIVGVQLPFFTIWLSSRGLDALQIAGVLSVQPIIRIASTLIASRRADRFGDHGAVLVGCAAAATAAYAAMGLSHSFFAILVAAAMLALSQGPMGPLADGITFGEAKRRRETGLPQLHYSWVRGWGSVSILVFLTASGPIAAHLANTDMMIWVFVAVAGFACLACFASLAGLGGRMKRCESRSLAPLERPKLVILVIGSATLIQSSHAMVNAFGALHWKAQGHDANFVAMAWVAALATEVAAFLLAGRWFGGESRAASFLVVGGVGAVLRWILMACDLAPTGIFFAQALHGASCAAVLIGPAYLLAELGGKERLAQSQAWLASAVAGGTSLLTLSSGPLYATTGERGYLAMAVVAFVGLLMAVALARLLEHEKPQAHEPAKRLAEAEAEQGRA